MWLILCLISITYIPCIICAYQFHKIAYSELGVWYTLNFVYDDWFWILMPIFNIYPAIDYLRGKCYKDKGVR
jgi:hypothetical protein